MGNMSQVRIIYQVSGVDSREERRPRPSPSSMHDVYILSIMHDLRLEISLGMAYPQLSAASLFLHTRIKVVKIVRREQLVRPLLVSQHHGS